MDVLAYPATGQPTVLGSIAEHIWTNGFRYDAERAMDFPLYVRGTRPGVIDLENRIITFSFAAGRAFTNAYDALFFMTTHAGLVPAKGDLEFVVEAKSRWLIDCGISRVSLVEKRGALVVFGYDITGGYWNATRPLSSSNPA
jgi:hypothetical protein